MYSSLMDESSYLSSGYETISSGSDEQLLVNQLKQNNDQVLLKQEEIRKKQIELLHKLQNQKEMQLFA